MKKRPFSLNTKYQKYEENFLSEERRGELMKFKCNACFMYLVK